jgi:outer membrane protein assembly factor BamB
LKHRQIHLRKLSLAASCLILLGAISLLTACSKSDDALLFTFTALRKCVWSAEGQSQTPVVVGDNVYYLGGYPWNNQIFLHSVNKLTGKENWSTKDGIEEFKVSGDQIFCVGRTNLFKREPGRRQETWLRGISTKDGSTLWNRNVLTTSSGMKLVAAEDMVYCLANYGLSALTKVDGKIIWESPEALYDDVQPNVFFRKGLLIAQLRDRSIGFFEAKSGKMIDQLVLPKLDSRLPRVLEMHDDILLVANGDCTFAMCDVVKRDKFETLDVGWITSKIKVTSNMIYFGSGPMPDDVKKFLSGQKVESEAERASHFNVLATPVDAKQKRQQELNQEKDTNLNAISIDTRKVVWKIKIDEGKIVTEPTVGKDILCFGVEGETSSFVYTLDPASGKLISKTPVATPVSNPVIVDGMIFVRSNKELVAIEPKSGKSFWKFQPNEMGLDGGPVVDNSMLYIGGKDSNLYAFKTDLIEKKFSLAQK